MQKFFLLLLATFILHNMPCYAADEESLKSVFSKQAREYATLFENRNAEEIANLFRSDGEFTLPDGMTLTGRENIKIYLKKYFEEIRPEPVDVFIKSVKELVPGKAAIETGTTTVRGESKPLSQYRVLHVKEDDQWKIAWVEETLIPLSHKLDDLDWLIGEWRPKLKDSKVKAKVVIKKTGKGNFIRVLNKGRNVNAFIGVNPHTGCLHSWHFGADGGIGEGDWLFRGNFWVLTTSGMTKEGFQSSAVYKIKRSGKNGFSMVSTDRFINGVRMPDLMKVEMVRAQGGK